MYILDVAEMKWVQINPMNQAWVSHKSFYCNDKIYAIGGDYGLTSEVYDIKLKWWSFI